MTLASFILLLLKISVVLLVFSIGLETTYKDMVYLFRRPSQLLRSFLSMNVVMPVLAAAIALTFDLRPPVKIALVALAISPVPPLLPKRQAKTGATGSYPMGLLFAMALLSIAFIPIAIKALDVFSLHSLHMPFFAIVKLVFLTVLAPLSVGVLVRNLAAGFASRIVKPTVLGAAILLFGGLLPVLLKSMPAIISLVGNGTIAVFGVFVIVGLAVGHSLGGPVPTDRPVLALATASRHPAIAATIAIANFPEQKMVFPAILLYLILNVLICLPYLAWLKRRSTSPTAVPPPKLAPR
jgi:BASS family bile acid:Na+ symporter